MRNVLTVAAPAVIAFHALLLAGTARAAASDQIKQLLSQDRHQQALAAGDEYLQDHPDDARARFLRAVALVELGRDKDAEAVFRDLAEAQPDWPEPANNLAVLYARRGDYESARHWLEKALGTQPAYATAHANLGEVYAALSAVAYRKALDDPEAETASNEVQIELDLVPRLHGTAGAEATAGESAAEPNQPATTTASDADDRAAPAGTNAKREAVRDLVERWRSAWADQDVEAYLNAYAESFRPEDQASRAKWQAERRDRVTAPERIDITLSDREVVFLATDRARVTFEQAYNADNYADRVIKTLIVTRGDDGWRIRRESDRPL